MVALPVSACNFAWPRDSMFDASAGSGPTLTPMADSPEIHYAKSGDRHVAYQTLGQGPIDLLGLNTGCNIWLDRDDEPHWGRFDSRLASFTRLIRFDPSGVGLSDPMAGGSGPTIECFDGRRSGRVGRRRVTACCSVGRVNRRLRRNVVGRDPSGADLEPSYFCTASLGWGATWIIRSGGRRNSWTISWNR